MNYFKEAYTLISPQKDKRDYEAVFRIRMFLCIQDPDPDP